ncbi:MAG: hypothetical protein M1829_003591 [Trizodia sp. TS-e1964]|nr:MAG: hypothetical protein M1829_003591 [Trizodia sp. TS-e1964]
MARILAVALGLLAALSQSAPTDTISDADVGQSGYLPNHNMDPAIVDSPSFGQLWKIPFNAKEQFYAKPLVYTPVGGTATQLVFLASSQNWIRTLDAKSGAILNQRQVQTPFLQSDIGCTDIPNTIGIIGTPVIDPATDIAYFFAKSYIANYRAAGATGTYNGVYYFYAVNVNTLADVPGFPILVDGSVADNDPLKYFIGGVILQRPSLVKVGNVVYGAFGGHCDLYNYTGTVLGIDINQKKIITNFAMESGSFAPDSPWNVNGGGGQAGIWMSGMGIASDGARLFVVTGNGQGHENTGSPASGSSGCQTLGQAIVNLAIDGAGKLSLQDYFQPYDYQNLDGGDLDLGSGGIAMLDPKTFHGGGISRMGVTSGKNGKIYVVDLDNLGGYRLGTGQTDRVVQTIVTQKAVFGGAGSYPLEGGYFYSTPVGYPTYVYKLGSDATGRPQFSIVSQTAENSAGRVGVGIPTITSLNGQPGTAILWMADPDAGLRAWYAVPGSSPNLQRINLPQIQGANKFQRPAFGDSRLYITDSNGNLYCLGSPVNLPLNCSSPVDFGDVPLGSSATRTVTCKANIAINSIVGATVGDNHFSVNNASLPQGPVAQGATFSFPATWNLTGVSVSDASNSSFGNTSPGIKSTPLTIFTVNSVTGYASQLPISLTGNEVSQNAFLDISPPQLSFPGQVLNKPTDQPSVDSNFVIANSGLMDLNIIGYAWTPGPLDSAVYTNVTVGNSASLGTGFTTSQLIPVGGKVLAGKSVTITVTFTPVNGAGNYQSYLYIYTDGGNRFISLVGSASAAPVAVLTISTAENGWLPPSNLLMDFGNVAPGSSQTRQIRICNTGGSSLTITKSKPPGGDIRATAAGIDLHESQQIAPNDCAYGTVLFGPNVEPVNVADNPESNTWTLNTDDPNFGVHIVNITGTVVDRQVGPLINGKARFQYLGCYQDGTNGRVLPAGQGTSATRENGECQQTCLNLGYTFSGTGMLPPSELRNALMFG